VPVAAICLARDGCYVDVLARQLRHSEVVALLKVLAGVPLLHKAAKDGGFFFFAKDGVRQGA
jgi:hypothetical protein